MPCLPSDWKCTCGLDNVATIPQLMDLQVLHTLNLSPDLEARIPRNVKDLTLNLRPNPSTAASDRKHW